MEDSPASRLQHIRGSDHRSGVLLSLFCEEMVIIRCGLLVGNGVDLLAAAQHVLPNM